MTSRSPTSPLSFLHDRRVAVIKESDEYCRTAPYHASDSFPEFPDAAIGSSNNPAYRGVRSAFWALEMDKDRYGFADWNPLGELIGPGKTVILKPNLVSHRNLGESMYGLTDTDGLVTHGSVIRAVLDYVVKGLAGEGRIIVCDCPVQGTDWQQAVELVGLDKVANYIRAQYPEIDIELKDFRLGTAVKWGNTVVKRIVDDSMLQNYRELDLKSSSLLMPLMHQSYEFGVSDYPRWRMTAAHTPETNKYLYPKELLEADVMINLPKMKVHMKAGITCAMKNFVGTIGHKDYLPHFRFGGPKTGGDEYPEYGPVWRFLWACMHKAWDYEGGKLKILYIIVARIVAKYLGLFRRIPNPVWALGAGSWFGNDTLWRTVLDINRAYLYYNSGTNAVDESNCSKQSYLAILDGIVGGEKESPLSPTPRRAGFIIASCNPLALDTVAATVMGLDYRKIPQLCEAWKPMPMPLSGYSPEDIDICGTIKARKLADLSREAVCFVPSMGFVGHIELENSAQPDTNIQPSQMDSPVLAN